jgi:hypothetical protein
MISQNGEIRKKATPTDFKELRGALYKSDCVPSDLDGVYERDGHFLFLEVKHGGEQVSTGQYRMLENLRALNPNKVTTVIVYCVPEKHDETGAWKFIPTHWDVNSSGEWVKGGVEEFRQFLRDWENGLGESILNRILNKLFRPLGINFPNQKQVDAAVLEAAIQSAEEETAAMEQQRTEILEKYVVDTKNIDELFGPNIVKGEDVQ